MTWIQSSARVQTSERGGSTQVQRQSAGAANAAVVNPCTHHGSSVCVYEVQLSACYAMQCSSNARLARGEAASRRASERARGRRLFDGGQHVQLERHMDDMQDYVRDETVTLFKPSCCPCMIRRHLEMLMTMQ